MARRRRTNHLSDVRRKARGVRRRLQTDMAEDALDRANERLIEDVEEPLLGDPLVGEEWAGFTPEEKRESLADRMDVLETVVRSVRHAAESDEAPESLEFVDEFAPEALDEIADTLTTIGEDVDAATIIDDAAGRPEPTEPARQAAGRGLTSYAGAPLTDLGRTEPDLDYPSVDVEPDPDGSGRLLVSTRPAADDSPRTTAEAVQRGQAADRWRERTQRWARRLAKWHLHCRAPDPPAEPEPDVEGAGRVLVAPMAAGRDDHPPRPPWAGGQA